MRLKSEDERMIYIERAKEGKCPRKIAAWMATLPAGVDPYCKHPFGHDGRCELTNGEWWENTTGQVEVEREQAVKQFIAEIMPAEEKWPNDPAAGDRVWAELLAVRLLREWLARPKAGP